MAQDLDSRIRLIQPDPIKVKIAPSPVEARFGSKLPSDPGKKETWGDRVRPIGWKMLTAPRYDLFRVAATL